MSDEVENGGSEEIRDPKAVLDALERAKADAKKFREELEALQGQYAELEKSRDALKSTVQSYEDGDNVWQGRTKELLVKGALGKNADRVMEFINLDAIDFDDAGKATGLDEEVSRVKSKLPELFDAKRQVAGAADLFEKGHAPKTKSGTEAQVARLFGHK